MDPSQSSCENATPVSRNYRKASKVMNPPARPQTVTCRSLREAAAITKEGRKLPIILSLVPKPPGYDRRVDAQSLGQGGKPGISQSTVNRSAEESSGITCAYLVVVVRLLWPTVAWTM
jgi:hypothetical protein